MCRNLSPTRRRHPPTCRNLSPTCRRHLPTCRNFFPSPRREFPSWKILLPTGQKDFFSRKISICPRGKTFQPLGGTFRHGKFCFRRDGATFFLGKFRSVPVERLSSPSEGLSVMENFASDGTERLFFSGNSSLSPWKDLRDPRTTCPSWARHRPLLEKNAGKPLPLFASLLS
jgi:hypothetical protein